MAYSKAFNGYIADVPKLWFKRCDGRIFQFDELTDASVTPQLNYTEVSAGWSLYPVAYLPGQSTFEMSVTSGKFEADLFVMTNATEFEHSEAYDIPTTERHIPSGAGVINLEHDVANGKISINGLELGSSVSAGVFTVTDGKKVTLNTGDFVAGQEVEVNYYYSEEAEVAEIDNMSSAVGEAVLVYPVYGGDSDCTNGGFAAGSIIGRVILKVYKARVTQQPGLNGSYKQASTFQFTLSALDAKRNDGKTYSIAFVRE